MKSFLFKTLYLRDHSGQYVCGISVIKLAAVAAIMFTIGFGIIYSMIVAPTLNKPISRDYLQEAVENAVWVTTGTQESVDGNVIWSSPTDNDSSPAIYLGSDTQTLYKWHEWELEETRKELDKWKKKAGEPTAILSYVCRQNGITGKECPITLYAMAQHESYFGKAMSGDGGRSQGYFHILDIHKLPKSCTHDLECSADFTLKRMIRLGYKTNPGVAVMLHNGTPNTPTTLKYLASVNAKKALWPK